MDEFGAVQPEVWFAGSTRLWGLAFSMEGKTFFIDSVNTPAPTLTPSYYERDAVYEDDFWIGFFPRLGLWQ